MEKFYTKTKKYCPKCKKITKQIQFSGDLKCEECKNILQSEERPTAFNVDEMKKSVELENISIEMFEKHFKDCSIQERSIIREEHTRRERNKYGW